MTKEELEQLILSSNTGGTQNMAMILQRVLNIQVAEWERDDPAEAMICMRNTTITANSIKQ